jgi:Deoxyribodipyrimidine photolyase
MWFRQDLRLSDNPAFIQACHKGTVIPVYIFDEINAGDLVMGSASKWWLHHALKSLNSSLNDKLNIFSGDPLEVILYLIKKYGINGIYWNRCS